MELELKMCRFESAPWGFRLVGGADFELPLTVVKVTEGGLAEQAGMRIGDIVIRINDKSTAEMSHTEVHKTITECGNNFFLSVYREENPEIEYIQENENATQLQTQQTSEQQIMEMPLQQATESQEEVVDRITQNHEEQLVVDEEVAEITSTDEQTVSEVEQKKGFFQTSEVFQTIKEESWKTMVEKEKEKRQWSTFLQKPNRPIPKSKFEPDIPMEPYRVTIIKQQKPRVAPDRPPSPPPPQILEKVTEQEEEDTKEEPSDLCAENTHAREEDEQFEPPTDSEVPNLEPTDETLNNNETVNTEECGDVSTADTQASITEKENIETEEESKNIEPPKKTEEEIVFEKQLTDIQKQLLALSSLPSTIQATLDAVTRQLSELLPNVKLDLPFASKIVEVAEPCSHTEEQKTDDGQQSECTEDVHQSVEQEKSYESECVETLEETTVCEQQPSEEQIVETKEEAQQPTTQETTIYEEKSEEQFMVEEHSTKTQKELVMLELEHKQRLIKERTGKRPPRAFGPLTPQERPLVLPGGRKWRRPKDAFNDEFIADILSAQAELIVGHTLGVNFLKYKKPEKHIDLEKSEVYKVIHSLDDGPRRGIEVRPEKVVAAADVCTA